MNMPIRMSPKMSSILTKTPHWVIFFKCHFLQVFFFSCESTRDSYRLYPSEKKIEINYLCNLPFFDENSLHQQWGKSKSTWLIINKERAIVFFENNRTYNINRNIDISLHSGKYSCIQ